MVQLVCVTLQYVVVKMRSDAFPAVGGFLQLDELYFALLLNVVAGDDI